MSKFVLAMSWYSTVHPCWCSCDIPQQGTVARQTGSVSSGDPETLVLYTYSNSDMEYERNFHYFVQHGMAEGDGCDYIIIVQEVLN